MIDRRRFVSTGLATFAASTIGSRWAPARASTTQLTMQLDWFFNVQFAGVFLAADAGLYDEAGLEVQIEPWADGVDVSQVIAGNPMALGCGEQNIILAAQASGAPIKAVATMLQASPTGLMAHPESGIKSLDDLRGRRVGMHIDGVRVLQLVKGVKGIPDEAIEIVEIPYEGKFDRVLSGELAAVQCYVVDEPIGVETNYGIEPTVLRLSEYGFVSYAQTIVANDQLLAEHPDAVKAFLGATFAGWTNALADIPAAAEIVVDRFVAPDSKYRDLPYQTRSLELIADYVLLDGGLEGIGTIDPAAWSKASDLMVRYGIIDQAPALEASLATGFWPAS